MRAFCGATLPSGGSYEVFHIRWRERLPTLENVQGLLLSVSFFPSSVIETETLICTHRHEGIHMFFKAYGGGWCRPSLPETREGGPCSAPTPPDSEDAAFPGCGPPYRPKSPGAQGRACPNPRPFLPAPSPSTSPPPPVPLPCILLMHECSHFAGGFNE